MAKGKGATVAKPGSGGGPAVVGPVEPVRAKGPDVVFRVPAQTVKRGRPSTYTDEVGEEICQRLAAGESLRQICSGDGMPGVHAVYGWISSNEGFGAKYARAREQQADTLFDEIGDTARKAASGEIDPQAARVFIDAVKWQASKLRPKTYGDKLEVETKLSDTAASIANQLERLGTSFTTPRQVIDITPRLPAIGED